VESVADDGSFPDLLIEETFADLAAYAEGLTGATAAVIVRRMADDYPFIEITPHLDGARCVRLVADQWVVLEVEGGPGGRWELDYGEEGIAFARMALEAVVRGRVEERLAFGRSEVALTFQDGSIHRETGYEGCLTLLVPLPGWRRWGEVRRALPYSG
jgi:hypothetical protein